MNEKETMSVYGHHSICRGLWERQSILRATLLPPLCPGLWLSYTLCNLIRAACLKWTHRSLCSHHSLNEISALITDGQGLSTQHSTSGLKGCHSKAFFFHNNASKKFGSKAIFHLMQMSLEKGAIIYVHEPVEGDKSPTNSLVLNV